MHATSILASVVAHLSRYDDVLGLLAALPSRAPALLPGPDLAVRARAAFAWQDEVLAELT